MNTDSKIRKNPRYLRHRRTDLFFHSFCVKCAVNVILLVKDWSGW
ncbi:MAG: hypothetical protein U0175_10985 [Caldilineaceae bacterium]